MPRYFAQVNFVVEANSVAGAEQIQQEARELIATKLDGVVDASADEAVEEDEFGHAG